MLHLNFTLGLETCTVNMLATEPSLQPWIILYCVNVTHFSIHLLMGHLNSSHLLTIVNNTTVIQGIHLSPQDVAFHSSIYPEVEVLDHIAMLI